MQIKEYTNGILKAVVTPIDVIHYLDNYSEFQLSPRVSSLIKEFPNFLDEDYWYLVVGSKDSPQESEIPTEFNWQISVADVVLQEIVLEGCIELVDTNAILS
jgi:hypothetical protein